MFAPPIPCAEHVGDPPGDDPGLARPGAGQDQERAVDVGDGLALGGGQVGEQVHQVGPSLGEVRLANRSLQYSRRTPRHRECGSPWLARRTGRH